MQKNNPPTRCRINIVSNTTPIFVTKNLDQNTTNTSLCEKVMNTVMLPSSEYSSFNIDELKMFQNKDVFFIQDQSTHELEATQERKMLMRQLKPYCHTVRTINLFDFIAFNNIELARDYFDLHTVFKASHLDDSAFHHLLIYFVNFDKYDLQFTLQTYTQAECEIEEIHSLLLNGMHNESK